MHKQLILDLEKKVKFLEYEVEALSDENDSLVEQIKVLTEKVEQVIQYYNRFEDDLK